MQDRPLAAASSVLVAMAIIGLIDQFVVLLADGSSLWTFHVLRSALMWALALGWLAVAGRRLRVRRWRGVVARSAVMSCAMIVYFGALGFLPVAQAAAGLFTAPLWVLLIGAVAYGRPVGWRRGLAAAAGFAGVILVLAPDPASVGPAALAPVLAGAFYALAAIATRAWCDGEEALTLALGTFAAMALWGLGGIAVAAVVGPGEGFLGRGWVAPDARAWAVIAVQAVGSLVAVVLLTRGYQLADASVASVFEYSVLGFSALFGWAVWGAGVGAAGLAGLTLIAGAGWAVARGGSGGQTARPRTS